MKNVCARAGVVAMLGGVAASAALGGGTINDGNAQYQLVGNFNEASGNGAFPTTTIGQDQLFQNMWYYRQEGAGMRKLSALQSPAESYVGNTATLNWSANGPFGAFFGANMVMTLTDGDGAGTAAAQLLTRLTVTSQNSVPVTFHFYNLVDMDLASTISDNASLFNADPTHARYTDPAVGAAFGDHRGFGASRWQISSGSTLRGAGQLGGSAIYNLANSGSIANADAASAFQWTFTLQPGESFTMYAAFSVGMNAIPAPGAVALLGLGGLVASRRRRA